MIVWGGDAPIAPMPAWVRLVLWLAYVVGLYLAASRALSGGSWL